jgi:predicted lipoprotein with Yx(FWY)xxD motif
MKRQLVIVLAAAALLVGACGDDSSSDDVEASGSSSGTAAPDTTSAPADAEPDYGGGGPTATTTAPDAGEATVALAEVGGLGPVLVDPDGLTLYLFEMDEGTTSACLEGCAEAWPALAADGEPVAGEGVDQALLSTADGQVPGHVAYDGHLLYTFSGDAAPGDVNGLDLPGWHPVDAAGNAVGAG